MKFWKHLESVDLPSTTWPSAPASRAMLSGLFHGDGFFFCCDRDRVKRTVTASIRDSLSHHVHRWTPTARCDRFALLRRHGSTSLIVSPDRLRIVTSSHQLLLRLLTSCFGSTLCVERILSHLRWFLPHIMIWPNGLLAPFGVVLATSSVVDSNIDFQEANCWRPHATWAYCNRKVAPALSALYTIHT